MANLFLAVLLVYEAYIVYATVQVQLDMGDLGAGFVRDYIISLLIVVAGLFVFLGVKGANWLFLFPFLLFGLSRLYGAYAVLEFAESWDPVRLFGGERAGNWVLKGRLLVHAFVICTLSFLCLARGIRKHCSRAPWAILRGTGQPESQETGEPSPAPLEETCAQQAGTDRTLLFVAVAFLILVSIGMLLGLF